MNDLIELGPECRERYFCAEHYPDLAALGVPVTGLSHLRGPYRVAQRLDRHLVEITLDGHGLGAAGAWRGRLEPGAVLCIPAGTPFRLESDAGAPWSTAWVHLEPRRWKSFPADVQRREGVEAAPLEPLLGLLDGERDRDDDVGAPLKRALGEAFVLWLRRVLQPHPGAGVARHRAALEAIFQRVRAQPGEDWSIERLAALAGCSRSQLHRRCIEVFGRGPAAQVTQLRMREAESWLSATGVPLKVIADRLGYANPYHFSTAFKRWSGRAPAAYRDVSAKGRTTASSRATYASFSPTGAA